MLGLNPSVPLGALAFAALPPWVAGSSPAMTAGSTVCATARVLVAREHGIDVASAVKHTDKLDTHIFGQGG
jgi:hypothetical protein